MPLSSSGERRSCHLAARRRIPSFHRIPGHRPEQQYLGYGQLPAWRYAVQAVDDSCLLDHNALPARAPFAWRTAGNALSTLANDVLPGGLDESGVQDVSPVNQFPIVPQKTWTSMPRS